MGKQEEYLDKVVNHFVERFKDVDGRPDSTRVINSMDDFVDFGETFGLTDLELNYVYHKYKYVQGWDGEDKSSWYLDKNINESVDKKKEKYLDKIVEHLVNRTKYDTDHLNVYIIKFPFSDTWEVFGSDGVMSSIYDIYPKRFENYRWKFDQEMIEVFDLIEHESDYVWEKYFEGARFFGKEYANSDGLINESVDKKKDYLDKILERLKSETEFKVVPNDEPVGHKYDYYWKYPFSEFTTLSPYYPTNKSSNFHKHCRNIYGLSNEEIEDYILPNYYNWFKYNNPIYKFSNVETLFKNTTINESHVDVLPYMDDTEFIKNFTKDLNEKQKGYLDKVVEHILRETDIDYKKRRVHYPFSSIVNPGLKGLVGDSTYSFQYTLPFSGPFIRYCNNIFPLNEEEKRYVHGMYTGIINSKIRKYYVDNDIYNKYYNVMGTKDIIEFDRDQ